MVICLRGHSRLDSTFFLWVLGFRRRAPAHSCTTRSALRVESMFGRIGSILGLSRSLLRLARATRRGGSPLAAAVAAGTAIAVCAARPSASLANPWNNSAVPKVDKEQVLANPIQESNNLTMQKVHESIRKGRHKELKRLLSRRTRGVKGLVDAYGRTPLMIAAMHGRASAIHYLVNETNVDVNAGDNHGLTALHQCCRSKARYSPVKIADMLLKAGAQPDREDRYGFTAFHQAVIFGQHEIVRLMVKNDLVDVNLQTGGGAQSTKAPGADASDDSAPTVPSDGAVPLASVDKDTALHMATRIGNNFMSEQLLLLGASHAIANTVGNTPLHEAVRAQDYSMTRLLVKAGADPTVTNNEGKMPYEMCSLTSFGCIRSRMALVGMS